MKTKLLLLTISFLVLSGCATQPLTLNYAPTSTLTVEGTMNVGDFRYIPGEGEKVLANQIRNTALGSVIFEKNIDQYIETALFTESRFVGINLNETAKTVYGEINEFLIDDLGFSVDWTLDIRYIIDGCYDNTHLLEKRTQKFIDVFGTLNEVIKLNIEMLLADDAFKSCINDNPSSANEVTPIADNSTPESSSSVSTVIPLVPVPNTKNLYSSRYQYIIDDLNSENAIEMQRAAKKVGEEKLYQDEAIILASISVLEKALTKSFTKKDKYLVDGLSWCAINLGSAGDKRATDVLVNIIASSLPRKFRSHAIKALQDINSK